MDFLNFRQIVLNSIIVLWAINTFELAVEEHATTQAFSHATFAIMFNVKQVLRVAKQIKSITLSLYIHRLNKNKQRQKTRLEFKFKCKSDFPHARVAISLPLSIENEFYFSVVIVVCEAKCG